MEIKLDDEDLEESSPPAKRGRGRPKGSLNRNNKQFQTPEVLQTDKPFTLPQPAGFKKNQFAINVDPINFFDWWKNEISFPHEKKSYDWVKPPDDKPQTKARYKAYFYRKFPKIDPGLVGNKNSYIHVCHQWPFMKDGQPELDWQRGTLALFGTGRYAVVIIDYYASRQIASCEYEVFDWAHNPPKLNMDMVVMESPDNKVFIQQMRARGIKLPGDEGYKRYHNQETESDEDDMANQAAVEVLGEIAKRNINQPPNNGSNSGTTDATMTAVINQLGQLTQTLLTNKGDDGTRQALLDAIRDLKNTQGKSSNEDMQALRDSFQAMMDRMEKQHDSALRVKADEIKDLKEEIRDLKQQNFQLQMKVQELSSRPPEDLLIQIDRVEGIRERLGVKGTTPRRIVEPAPVQEDGPPKWVKELVLPLALPLVQQYMQDQRAAAIAAAPAAQQAAMVAAATASQASTPQQQQASSTQQQQQQEPSPISQLAIEIYGKEGAEMLFNKHGIFINMIREPLIAHLTSEDKDGVDFANAIIAWHGKPVYDAARAVGIEELCGAIVAFNPVWKVVDGYKFSDGSVMNPAKLLAFVKEFVDAEEIMKQEDAEEGEESEESEENDEQENESHEEEQPIAAAPVVEPTTQPVEAAPDASASTSKRRRRSSDTSTVVN